MEPPEDEFTAASASGDLARIDAASAAIDEVDKSRPIPTPLASALWYADRSIPVFALRPGRKQPFASCEECRGPKCNDPKACGHDQCHGVLDATTDVIRLRRWWEAVPNANIGLATGYLFDVVDIDGPKGQASRAEHWEAIFAQIDADAIAKVLTPRPGGMHVYVPATGDSNGAEIVPGVDYRGAGGYVLAPPSVITPGSPDSPGPYRFLGTPELGQGGAA